MTKITELLEIKQASLKAIMQQGGWMLGYAVSGVIMAGLISYFAAKTVAWLAKTLRQKVFDQVLSFRWVKSINFHWNWDAWKLDEKEWGIRKTASQSDCQSLSLSNDWQFGY